MQKIGINSWNRKKHYDWFSTFTNPTYGMNVRMDVTKLYHYVKNNNQSFFIGMLYLVTKGCNMVDAMRLRIINDEVYLFDVINPSYTVKISDDNYDNVTQNYYDDYNVFYEYTKKIIDETKKQIKTKDDGYNPSDRWDYYYMTCLPWISIEGLTHPIPDERQSQSVPRICWDKFVINNDKVELVLNITVNHMLVDGFHLSMAFNNIQMLLNNVEDELK